MVRGQFGVTQRIRMNASMKFASLIKGHSWFMVIIGRWRWEPLPMGTQLFGVVVQCYVMWMVGV